jgi:hypothetical protein
MPQESILGLLFLICIHDLHKILFKVNLNGSYEITLFADDTSVIVNDPNHNVFENDINMIFRSIHEQFNTRLALMAQYVYSITVFISNNTEYFTESSKLYDIKTINNKNLFQPQSNLSIKGIHFMQESRYIIIFLLK